MNLPAKESRLLWIRTAPLKEQDCDSEWENVLINTLHRGADWKTTFIFYLWQNKLKIEKSVLKF